MKDRSGVDLFDRTRNLVDIVDRARFVIDVNDRNQRSFAVDFFQKIVYVHAAVPVEARAAHFDPPPRKFRRGGKYGGMLALGYDDVAAPSRGKKRLIIRLRTAGGKDEFVRFAPRYVRKQRRARLVHLFMNFKPFADH